MPDCQNFGSCLFSACFQYETPKVVQIESKCIGIFHKLLIVGFSAIVVVYVFVLNNGYQHIDHGARASTTCKIKGVASTSSTDPRVGKRIWDTADLYSHPVGDGSFFVTTNVIVTHFQVQGVCAEEANVGANCIADAGCEEGTTFTRGHGVSTGMCNVTTGTCIVDTWCPVENDSLPEDGLSAVLVDTKDFTVFIKNHVYFPYYKTTRSNLIETTDLEYIHSCRYHPQHHQYCPIFRIGDIANIAVESQSMDHNRSLPTNDSHFESMAIKGGVITISIIWDCDLDYMESQCKPRYEFSRLDKYGGNNLATGYNFRYSQNHDTGSRHLYKVYGILFLVQTEANARKFHLQTFLINLGSSLALLGLAPIIVEIVLLRLHRRREMYKKTIHEPKKALRDLMKETQNLQSDMLRSVEYGASGRGSPRPTPV